MTKTCTNCGQVKDEGEFYRDKTQVDGLAVWCKECRKEQERDRYRKKRGWKALCAQESMWPSGKPLPKGYKRCGNRYCRRVWPATREWWHQRSRGEDGLSSWCKECKKVSAEMSRAKKVKADGEEVELEDGTRMSVEEYADMIQLW